MGFVDERPVTHSVPSVIPAKVNPVRKELITAESNNGYFSSSG